MNIDVMRAAETLRRMGFTSAFAMSDSIGLDSQDAQRIVTVLQVSKDAWLKDEHKEKITASQSRRREMGWDD